MGSKEAELIRYLKQKGGMASFSELDKAGFNKALIKVSLMNNNIQKLDRGLYSLSEGMSFSNPDLVAISIKIPKGTVCLLSALAFHEATNEIPKYVDIAIPRGMHANKIKYPPVKFYRFAPNAWKAGIEKHDIEGHEIKVYSLAKTVVDCFKFRNKIGLDIAIQALKESLQKKLCSVDELWYSASICRVANVMQPYLESLQ
jgi:predicted transcriptional regulator of viral defense system